MLVLATRLVFANDPLSPLALLLSVLAIAGLAGYGWAVWRQAGRWRGPVLLVLRALAVATLGLILLQPSLLDYRPLEVTLSSRFATRQAQVASPTEAAPLLPPLGNFTRPQAELSRDVRVGEVVAPPVAYYKSESIVRVTLHNDGPPAAGEVVVSRLEPAGQRELTRAHIELPTGEQDVAIAVVPDALGIAAYGVSLTGFAGDSHPENNSAPFALQTARDSLRVLHIAGHPSWDVRFLREFLTSQPGIELISFYLLVEAEDFAPHSREELSLIPFPTEELFIKEIGNFDLIVVHNFPLGTYFLLTKRHHERMVEFVEEGGALLFLGGDQAYTLGSLQKTPVADVLPVTLPEAGKTADTYVVGPCQVRLAPDGLTHPLTLGRDADGEVPFHLAPLPELDGLNRLGEVKPGATLLANAVHGEHEYPLLVAGTKGRGRVLVVATDSLWRWAFPSAGGGDAPTIYRRLFMNAAAWLTRDPRMTELEILPDAERTTAGREASLRICTRASSEPGLMAHVEAEWLDIDGRLPSLRVEQEAPLHNTRCATVTLPAAKAGSWNVEATVETDARTLTGQDVVVVHRQQESYEEALRRRIAPLLGLSFGAPPLLEPFDVELPEARRTLQVPVLETLWVSPLFFFVFALCLLTEWLLRRRWGYL